VETLLPRVRALVSAGMRTREAAHEVARAHGASANDLYRAFLVDLRRDRDEADDGELVDLVGADDDERV
jgi:hypothetical protein